MQARHQNRYQYFKEQGLTTEKHVLPYIEAVKPVTADSDILEIGCGEGGNMRPFLDRGCRVVGIDINGSRLKLAATFFEDHPHRDKLSLVFKNIYDSTPEELGKFDVIFLRDVIEHIPDQLKFLSFVKGFLKEDGVVFFGFPPWQMPFGGHQQVLQSKVLSKLPYTHLLPNPMYVGLMKLFGIPKESIRSRLEIKETGISIERMNKILSAEKYEILKRDLFLINPNYEVKFGLKKRMQISLVAGIPHFRNYLTTCAYYLVRPDNA